MAVIPGTHRRASPEFALGGWPAKATHCNIRQLDSIPKVILRRSDLGDDG
jgi:hypothetical protein